MIYNINYKRLATLLLPTFMRLRRIKVFLEAVIHPVEMLHTQLDRYRAETAYRLIHTGQTCRLRKVLNDNFDPVARRIYIVETGQDYSPACLYWRETGRWTLAPRRPDSLIINRRGFGGVNRYDFVVNVPVEYLALGDKIAAITNIYKLVGKRYSINFIT
jgi:hypothetical protein